MAARRHIQRRRRFGKVLAENEGWMTAAMIAEVFRNRGWLYDNIKGISHSLRGAEGIERLERENAVWFKMRSEVAYNLWLIRK